MHTFYEACFWSLITLQICNVLFSPKIVRNPFKKLTCLPLFEIKIFWPATTDFLLTFSSLILEEGMQMSWRCQISWFPNKYQTFKTQQHDSRILEKRFKKDLSQQLETWDLTKRKSIRKIWNWVETDASAQSPFYK